jgi:pheromone shutdown protein TraB
MDIEMRRKLAQLPVEEKIRKVGELIRLSREVKERTTDQVKGENTMTA